MEVTPVLILDEVTKELGVEALPEFQRVLLTFAGRVVMRRHDRGLAIEWRLTSPRSKADPEVIAS